MGSPYSVPKSPSPASAGVGPTLGVVIVTFESQHRMPALLADLEREAPGVPIQIVDNASSDTRGGVGIDVARHAHVRLPVNVGYGAAVNEGVRLLRASQAPDHIAFLNPDIHLTGPTLQQLVARVRDTPGCAVAAGPAVDSSGAPTPTAWGEPSFSRSAWYASGLTSGRVRELLRAVTGAGRESAESMAQDAFRVPGHVLGGAVVVDATAFESVGGFDEDFFLYWEDADLCARLRDAGYETWFFPVPPVEHGGGQSSRGIDDMFRRSWYLHSARLYADRHLSGSRRRRMLAGYGAGSAVGSLRRLARWRD